MLREEISRGEAIHNQAEQQAISKERYDQQHRQVTFQIGELVLCRVMGRRAKNQNRFEDPYRIISKNRDVYQVESVSRSKDKLERHVSDLRPYHIRTTNETIHLNDDSQPGSSNQNLSSEQSLNQNNPNPNQESSVNDNNESNSEQMQASTLLLVLLLVGPLTAIQFKEAPLVSWLPTHTYVSPNPTAFHLTIYWGNPCGVLRQFGVEESLQAIDQCNAVFQRVISDSVATAAQTHKAPIIQGPQTRLEVNQPVGKIVQKPMQPQFPMANNIANTEPIPCIGLPSQQPTGQARHKRGLTDFVVGAFASNVMETVVDRFFPNPQITDLQSRQQKLEEKAIVLNSQLSFAALQQRALIEGAEITAALVENNVQRLDTISYSYPQLTVVTADMVARMHLLGSFIERLRVSFRMRKPDVAIMAMIFKDDDLLDIDPNSIIENSVEVQSPAPNTLQVKFVARRRSIDTAVFAVNSFRFWGNLLEENASLYEYAGPRFIIYNNTANCVRGIHQASASYISATCADVDYQDQRLSNWKIIATETDPRKYASQTEVIEAYPWVFVSCYPANISIKGETDNCPPYPFILDWNLKWKTPSFEYTPSAIELNLNNSMQPVVVESHPVHFRNKVAQPIDTERAVNRVRELLGELKTLEEGEVLVPIPKHPVTYQHGSIIAIIVACIIISMMMQAYRLIYMIFKRNETIVKRKRENAELVKFYRQREESASTRRSREELSNIYHKVMTNQM